MTSDIQAAWVRRMDAISRLFPVLDDTRLGGLLKLGKTTGVSLPASVVFSGLDRVFEPFHDRFAFLEKQQATIDSLESAGWLPHDAVPFDLIEPAMTATEVDTVISRHLHDRWGVTGASLVNGVRTYGLDAEAGDVFAEAVMAHGKGLYRVAPRLLFPEIERVARKELHGGHHRPITSQRELRDAAGTLGLDDFATKGLYGLRLYDKLVDHLYAKIDTEERRAVAAADAVPNRHAALHGIVTYTTMQSSANMLFMVDFIFAAVGALKAMANDAALRTP